MSNYKFAVNPWSDPQQVGLWDAVNDATGGDRVVHSSGNSIRSMMFALNDLKRTNARDFAEGSDPELIADSTAYHAARLICSLPDYLSTPELDVDYDGNIEFEWSSGRTSFSIYATDTTKVIYVGVFSKTKYVSGSFSIDDSIDQSIFDHIRNVFASSSFF